MTSGWTFEHPWFLLALFGVAAAFWVRFRSRPAAVKVSTLQVFKQVPRTWRVRLRWLPDALRAIALIVLVIALARPQRIDQELLSGEGIDMMIALDMSGSMNAIDMSSADIQTVQDNGLEPDNRFEAARKILKDFIRGRKSDRIGLVVFGSEAYLRFPPTLDYVRLLNALDALVLDDGRRMGKVDACQNHCTIGGSGTAIGDALNRAYLRLEKAKSRSKMLILITDGKQEGGKMDPLTVPKYIASLPEKDRVRVFTFQVGSGRETRLPAIDPLRGEPMTDRFGRKVYQRPERPFPTDPELLRQIAQQTGGKFYDSYDAKKFAEDFKDLETTTFSVKVHTNRSELFHGWLLAGLALLLIEQLLRRSVLRTFP
ncbi:MAG: vWA domain-containing protein [Myxococcota bacterium]|jgi:Ca-activated chloride channel family protein